MMVKADALPKTSRWYLIMGSPKNGKTVAACTASAFSPDTLPAKEPIQLDDTLVIQFDTDGVESARRLGMIPWVYDLSMVKGWVPLMKALMEALNVATKAVKEQGVKFIIIDTATTLDTMLINNAKDLNVEGVAFWGHIQRAHMDFFMAIKSLPATVIILSHVKANFALIDKDKDKQATIRRATSLPGESMYSPDISGKSAGWIKAQCSAIFAIYKKVGNAQKAEQDKYMLITENSLGYEAGNRFELSKEEPAHLRHLFTKIDSVYKPKPVAVEVGAIQ